MPNAEVDSALKKEVGDKMIAKLLGGLGKSKEVRKIGDYYGEASESLAGVIGGGVKKDDILDVMRGDKSASDVGLDDSAGKVISTLKSRFDEGTLSTNEAVGAMYKNVQDTGEVFGGLSRAGETRSQAMGFGAFGNPENILGSVGMGAFVGAGASGIFGGDVTEGAMLGGMVGAGGSIGAKVFRESLGAMEESVMKKALGTNFKTNDEFIQEGTYGKTHMPFTRVNDEISLGKKNRIFSTESKIGERVLNEGTFTKNQTLSARNQNLEAINKMDLKDAPESMNFLDKQVMKQMKDDKSASMGVQSRFATISGAALAGMAFTSSAGSDKRRGFNRNRGNRI
jgi:hypothetical protein